VNFDDFFADFKIGVSEYFNDLENSVDLQKKFRQRLRMGLAGEGKA